MSRAEASWHRLCGILAQYKAVPMGVNSDNVVWNLEYTTDKDGRGPGWYIKLALWEYPGPDELFCILYEDFASTHVGQLLSRAEEDIRKLSPPKPDITPDTSIIN